MDRKSGMVATALALLLLAGATACDGGSESEKNPCLVGATANASAYLDGQLVELSGSGEFSRVAAPTAYGPVWADQWTINLDINFADCDHLLVLWVRFPSVGEAELTGQAKENVTTFTGLYSGELGAENLVKGSKLTLTAVGNKASGTFTAVFADGTVFSDGVFTDVPIN